MDDGIVFCYVSIISKIKKTNSGSYRETTGIGETEEI